MSFHEKNKTESTGNEFKILAQTNILPARKHLLELPLQSLVPLSGSISAPPTPRPVRSLPPRKVLSRLASDMPEPYTFEASSQCVI